MKRKKLSAAALTIAALILFSILAGDALTPLRTAYGSTWDMYEKEPQRSIDVMFFGSSVVYCDVCPAVLWRESGVTSYVMAGPEQTIPVTYRYIRQALRTQSPRIVVVDLTGMFYERYQNFTQVNLTYMPFGREKLAAIFESAEKERVPGLLFPLYDYHSRWSEAGPGEIKARLLGQSADPMAGYTFLTECVPQTGVKPREWTPDEENYARNLDYLKRIADFCAARGARLVLASMPGCWPWTEELRARLRADAAALGAEYRDFNDDLDAIGADLSADFVDALHYNAFGAEKFSRYLAESFLPSLGLGPTAGADAALWDGRAAEFDRLLGKQA